MKLSLPTDEFKDYVLTQMNHFFPDNKNISVREYNEVFDIALDRTSYCFKHINIKSYYDDESTSLNHLHANQYATFLWFLSNTVWDQNQNGVIANKLFYLNKALHGFSCSYEAKLPQIFVLLHLVGTVLGKAEYSDYFVVAQGCTVGAHHGVYPKIGRGVAMLPHSSIVGNCTIGDRVSVGINTTVYIKNVPDDTIVYGDGSTGTLCFKEAKSAWAQHLFNVPI